MDLSFDGHRYEGHSDLINAPVAQPLGAADEVGCASDSTVYGTVDVYSIRGISAEVAIAAVINVDGDRSIVTYLRDDQPRDRAPQSWPAPLPPGAFE